MRSLDQTSRHTHILTPTICPILVKTSEIDVKWVRELIEQRQLAIMAGAKDTRGRLLQVLC